MFRGQRTGGLRTYGAAGAALALAIAVVAGGTVGTHFEGLVLAGEAGVWEFLMMLWFRKVLD